MGLFFIPNIEPNMSDRQRRHEYIRSAIRNLELLLEEEEPNPKSKTFDYLIEAAADSISKARTTKPSLYILFNGKYDIIKGPREHFSLIGVFSNVKLLAKTARNWFRLDPDSDTLYVTEVATDEYYGELINLDIISWEDFKKLPRVKDTITWR